MAFEAILADPDVKPRRWLRFMLIASLLAHAAAIVIGVVHSLWQVDEMPLPAVQVTLMAAPPPPPPPPPASRSNSGSTKPKVKPTEVKPHVLVQPKDKPEPEKKPEPQDDDKGEDKGQVGGVQGGVVGGVQGGVVGGVVGAPAPAPVVQDTGPKMISAQMARAQLLINPNVDPYRVTLPRALERSGEDHTAVLRVCVSAQGAVTGVQILKSAGPAFDPQIPTVLSRWRYRPLTIDGRPTPFCYLLRYEITQR